MSRHPDLLERRDQALRDLAELDEQVTAGEIDEATAGPLRARYEVEATDAIAALERTTATVPRQGSGRAWSRRRLGGVSLLAAATAAAAVLVLPDYVAGRPAGGFVTGNEAAAGGGGRDLSQVTTSEMEQVVATNPGVVDMRLALARRYLDDGDHEKAFEHYMAVLDREDHPEAMAYLGWLVFLDGDPDLALLLLDASLEREPDNAETTWFLANVHLYGKSDPAAAIPLLERLAARNDLGAQAEDVERTLQAARRQQAASD